MELAKDKSACLKFRGRGQQYKSIGKDLGNSRIVKDFGIHVAADAS